MCSQTRSAALWSGTRRSRLEPAHAAPSLTRRTEAQRDSYMPRSDDENDFLHTFTSEGEGKSKSTRIAPLEVGRDEAPARLLALDEIASGSIRTPPSGTRLLHFDSAGELVSETGSGTTEEVRGADDLVTLTGSPVPVGSGTNLELEQGQSITDSTGVERVELQSDRTRIRDDTGGARRIDLPGAGKTLFDSGGSGFRFEDRTGGFTVIEYDDSSTSPGTLPLENAVVDFRAGLASTTGDSMTANPESDTEDGFIEVEISGTRFQIPAYTP